MKTAYPVIITPGKEYQVVYIPDFDTGTEGKTIADAIEMARDAIGELGLVYQDTLKKPIPEPSLYFDVVKNAGKDAIVAFADVDFDYYRKLSENRSVKKNCTIPAWLCAKAEEEGVNFSQVLQDALRERLRIN